MSLARGYVLATLALLTGACGGGLSAAPPKPPAVEHGLSVKEPETIPVELGERLLAKASTVGMSVGTLEMQLKKPCVKDAGQHWIIDSKLGTAGLLSWFNKSRGYTRTLLDKHTLRPEKTTTLVIDGDEWRRYEVEFGEGTYRYRTENSDGDKKSGTGASPDAEPIYDTQTAYVLLRTWQPEPKEQSYFYVVLGKDLWRADVRFEGPQRIEHDDGKISVLHLKGKAHRVDLKPGEEYSPRAFGLWLTADKHRVPIRVTGDGSLGAIHFDLSRREVVDVCAEASSELDEAQPAPQEQAVEQVAAATESTAGSISKPAAPGSSDPSRTSNPEAPAGSAQPAPQLAPSADEKSAAPEPDEASDH